MLSISDGCLQCGHSIIRTEDEECVECEKCGLLQCWEECKTNVSAYFTVKTIDGEKLKFYIYNDIVAKITDRAPQEVTKLIILKLKQTVFCNTAGASFSQLPETDNKDFLDNELTT